MIRFVLVLAALVTLTLILLPFQLLAMAFDWRLQRTIPQLFHRALCRLIGVRIRQVGQRSADAPALILSNHVSWLDICVIGALGPVVFVSKSEVARWPVFGWLSRLQRTVFIDRKARHRTGAATQEIGDRLAGGDAVVLFAEGTSSDGVRILPFRSALIGAVHHALGQSTKHSAITVQPLSLAYVRFAGLPVGRALRERVAWYGDADLMPHLMGVLSAGAIDVTVSWGDAVAHDLSADRKEIARRAEAEVRRMTGAALRAAPPALPAPATEKLPLPWPQPA
ncbi:1-acyl-sn-glycerol-3-phosphate acyltransferase [Rhodopseudomonas rhenobacensis]|uniref:1-acyl-sn-glycerol-3-phosphate acyltransferase n=1 Tax=Rhodopseudomonas rhenobacensis TaxID=87461 RepID=A0A7W7Z343_9BRAD|nr:lysophospholipid acyltransferase family protein [Rhodopseudomonas rhenobacensis]MBB5047079.1 1-acyl-sn-glycerol-3-phosphate acyltransferase [Rhodopseudomonas rhenobacensis]